MKLIKYLIMVWLHETDQVFDNGLVIMNTIDGGIIHFQVNRHRLKLYKKPLIQEEFT